MTRRDSIDDRFGSREIYLFYIYNLFQSNGSDDGLYAN